MTRVWRAPGRVNLIGEHTDYNLGFVCPVALQLETRVTAEPASDGMLRLWSEYAGEEIAFEIAELARVKPRRQWTDYCIGVAQQLVRRGVEIAAARLSISSTVPDGSGLSSSAALEVSTCLALLAGRPYDRLEIARLCQRAEIEFVGMPCGIMDQYISVFGEAGAAVRIDCRSLERSVVKLPPGAAIVAVNSMVKHELASSAYKERTLECAAAVKAIQEQHHSVESLRDVTPPQLDLVARRMSPVVARRARHVVTENARVESFLDAAAEGDLGRMGELFVKSHRSLRDDYEVSCAELDWLVDAAIGLNGVYGARMTGGGFGGCTVNLVAPEKAEEFAAEIARGYRERFGVEPKVYFCEPSAGAGEV